MAEWPEHRVRLSEAERRLTDIERRTEDVNVYRQEIANLWAAIREVREETAGLRRAVVTAAISFAGGALILAAAIMLGSR